MTPDQARAVLRRHSYIYGRSNTSKIRDPKVRAEIKAACIALKRSGEEPWSLTSGLTPSTAAPEED